MARVLDRKRIVLGVSGGIAAYKTIDLARQLSLAGVEVDVLLTQAAHQFVTPLTFQTLTRRPVYSDVFTPWTETEQGHITLAERADCLIVAPATAHTLAKLAHGMADDMLTAVALSCVSPMVVAPAMDHFMYLNAATQANLETLRQRGVRIVGPDNGPLASGLVGYGRLVEPARLIGNLRAVLGAAGPLAGVRVVVSAGPTREAIDPIRFISNGSSGKMGYAIAQACIDVGAKVTLVSGPTALTPPETARLVRVESAQQLAEAVREAVIDADALVMAAAVGDYRVAEVASEKIKKSGDELTLQLVRNEDILAGIQQPGLIKIGFAAETTRIEEYAEAKLHAKGLDAIVANHGARTMGSDENEAVIIQPGRPPWRLPSQSKSALAEQIADLITDLLERRAGVPAG